MKLNVISDLHCVLDKDGTIDWFDFEPEKLEPADYLIVAGDTGLALSERKIHRELRKRVRDKFKKVLTIKGNHSYWVFPEDKETCDDFETADELVMAPNDTIDLVDGDVAIIGTTLWTNVVSFQEFRMMNDYVYTPGFSPAVKLQRYKAESEWLRKKYNEYRALGKKIVIVTHHNPRDYHVLPEASHEHEDVSTAYWVYDAAEDREGWETEVEPLLSNFRRGLIRDVSDLKPEVWICGHIHEDLDIEHDGVRFVRHPIGYRFGWFRLNPAKFPGHRAIMESWYSKIVEI